MPHAGQMTLQRWRKKDVCTVARSRHFHTHHLSHATLSHTRQEMDHYMIRQELNPETCRWRKTEEGSDAGNTDCGNRVDQKIKILSATWFRRKTEEGSDVGNTDCGNRCRFETTQCNSLINS